MDRYTYRIPDGTALLTDELDGRYTANEVIDILAARLCAYEDTGIDPEELTGLLRSPVYIAACVLNGASITHERAIEIAKAEVEGRLWIAPCKMKTPIHMIVKDRNNVPVVPPFYIKTTYLLEGNLAHAIKGFGKTVFLTRKEAEAALAKMKEDASCTK